MKYFNNFSVLLSVYIKENPTNLDLALNSIFNQTILPNEVVLVCDGPLSVDLELVITNYIQKFPAIFKLVRLPVNVGLGNALKKGLTHTCNELVARMDTDDIALLDRFEKQIAFMSANPDISVLGTAVSEFDKVPGDLNQVRRLPCDSNEVLNFAKFRNPLNHPSVMFRKSAVLAAGSYEDMPLFEDYFLWVKMLLKGYCIANLEESLLHFRIGNDMVGRRHGKGYLKKEIAFLKAIKKLGFINNYQYRLSLVTKSPLRLLPKSTLTIIYEKFLR